MNKMARKYGDLTGQRFGKLTVIERVDDYISESGIHTMQWKCKCDCGNECVVKDTILKKEVHFMRSCGCSKDINKNYQPKSNHMSQQDIADWEKLYDYVNNEIMKYPKSNMLSKKMVLMLKGLRFGQTIRNTKISNIEKYSFEVILNTFKFCRNKIDYALQTKDFYSDDIKLSYILAIVENNINTIYMRMLNAKKNKEKIETHDISEAFNYVNEFKPKENKANKNNKFDDLW